MRRAALALVLATVLATGAASQEPPSGGDAKAWAELDAEARWVAYRADIQARPARRPKWVAFLAQTRDFQLLEWVVLTEGWLGWPENQSLPGAALKAADAPQWLRCAVWSLGHFDSHSLGAVQTALKESTGTVAGWIERFPEVLAMRGGARLAPFAQARVGDAARYLPPLDPDGVVLPFLDAPPEPTVLSGPRADAKVRYLHQVLRAIDMLVTAGLWEEPFASKLFGLARHPDPRVRDAACLAFTHCPAPQVPVARFLRAYAAAPDPAARAALLRALSYGDAPEAFLELHAVLAAGDGPCFDVALERLAETGNGFTLAVLERLADAKPSALVAARIAAAREKIAVRDGKQRQQQAESRARRILTLAAWAERRQDELGKQLAAWGLREAAGLATEPSVRAVVEDFVREGVAAAPRLRAALERAMAR